MQLLHSTPALHFQRRLPENIRKEDEKIFTDPRFVFNSIPESNIYLLKNVVVTHAGVVIKNGNVFSPSLIFPEHKSIYGKFFSIKERTMKHKRDIGKRCVLIHDYWSLNSFHWIADALQRLYFVEPFIEPDDVIILPKNGLSRLHHQTLLGFTNPTYTLGRMEYLKVPELIMPMHVAPSGHFNPDFLKQFRQRLLTRFKPDPKVSLGKRLFLGRDNATNGRRITNGSDFEATLLDFGFKKVNMDKYSFADQVSIAHNAECIISVHGAGLTNILFMNSGSSVIEIRQKGIRNSECYYSMADALDHRYFYLLAELTEPKKEIFSDILVNIDELKSVLLKL